MYEDTKRSSSFHNPIMLPGASGSRTARLPSTPGATSLPSPSRTTRSEPGTATVGEPSLIGIGESPRRFEASGQPVSVCHQLSMTGLPSLSIAHVWVSGSSRSPAENSVSNFDRSYFPISSPFGSTRRIARIAVGAVNMARTPCSAITRQNAPASGVPTGLPS